MQQPRRRPRLAIDWIVLGVVIGGVALLLLILFWPRVTDRDRPVADVETENGELQVRVGEPEVRPPVAPQLPAGGIAEFERRIGSVLRRERVRTQPLAGPIRIRAADIRLVDPARTRPIFRAEAAIGLLELPARSGAPAVISNLILTAPDIHLMRAGPGAPWNLERALDRAAPASGSASRPAGPIVVFRDATIRRGQLEVRDAEDLWSLRGIAARITSASLPPGLGAGITVASLAGTLNVPHEGFGPMPLAIEQARVLFPGEGFSVAAARIQLGETVVAGLDARLDATLPGAGIVATGRVARLRFQDVAFLHHDLPDAGTATFAFRIESVAAERFLLQLDDLDARADDSHVRGSLRVVAGGDRPLDLQAANLRLDPLRVATLEAFTGPLPYGGTLTGTIRTVAGELAFDLAALLTSPQVATPFRTDLVGRAAFTPDGLALRRLEARLRDVPLVAMRALAPAIPFAGTVAGTVVLTGPPGVAPLTLDVALTLAEGTVGLAGTLDLTGAAPAYDLRGTMAGVDLRRLLEPSLPPIVMNAQFTASGSGFDPATANASVHATGTFHGWHTRPGDGLRLDAVLAAGTVTLDTLHATAGPVLVGSAGQWRLLEPAAGALRYSVQVADLQPLTPFLPSAGGTAVTGGLAASGMLSGTIAQPTITGQASGREVRWGMWRASDFVAEYALQLGIDAPRISVSAAGRGVEAPVIGALAAARLELQLLEPGFVIDFQGQRVAGGTIELAADGTLSADGMNHAVLRRLAVDLEDERWVLTQPALVNWGGDPLELFVDALHIQQVGGEGAVLASGRLLPAEQASLRAEIRDLPLGDVLQLASAVPDVTGRLWATAEVTSVAGSARLVADFRLEEASLGGAPIAHLDGALNYDGAFLSGRASIIPAAGGSAELDARVRAELTLGLPPRLDIPTDALISANAVIDSLPLASFAPALPQVRDVGGVVSGRITVRGRQDAPELAGEVYIRNGEARILALNQQYRNIEGDLVLEGRRLVLRNVQAESDGVVRIDGAIEFEELSEPVADLRLAFDRFRAVGVEDQVDAAMWGAVNVTGSLRMPVISGAVLIDDGNIALPGGTGVADIGLDGDLIDRAPVEPGAPVLPGVVGASVAPWFRGLVVDGLNVRLGTRVWVTSRELRVQLAGDLTIYRDMQEMRVFGDLQGERGTFTLQVGPIIRRFDIVAANVRFFGGPDLDPAIDVTASRVVFGAGGTEIEILVRIGGTVGRPTLLLSTGTGVPVPESELLSFLLFGQPSFALGEAGLVGGGVFEGIIAGGIVDLAAMELEHALIEGLGLPLDFVNIRPGQGAFGLEGATLVLGREIGRDIFVTVDAGLAGIFGDVPARSVLALRLEWRIDREWRLRLGLEPVDRRRFFNVDLPMPAATTDQQFTVEIRRRWTY